MASPCPVVSLSLLGGTGHVNSFKTLNGLLENKVLMIMVLEREVSGVSNEEWWMNVRSPDREEQCFAKHYSKDVGQDEKNTEVVRSPWFKLLVYC